MSVASPAEHEHHFAASYGETVDIVERRQRMAVLLLIGGDVVFVLSILITYYYLRGLNTNNAWIPTGRQTVPLALTWVVAGVALLSLLAFLWGQAGARAGRPGQLTAGIGIGLLILLVDAVLQAVQIGIAPIRSTGGAYASSFLVMAGDHIAHCLLLLFVGIGLFFRARRGSYSAESHNQVRLVGYFWIWVVITAVLYAFTLVFTTSPRI
jgi:heme/copper-type cytochrome/quinol oxidase subunit 3